MNNSLIKWFPAIVWVIIMTHWSFLFRWAIFNCSKCMTKIEQKEVLFQTLTLTHQMTHPNKNDQWVIIMTRTIAENHFISEWFIWVIIMTHIIGALKTGIWNYVVPYICVGGAMKSQKFQCHWVLNFMCFKMICILYILHL